MFFTYFFHNYGFTDECLTDKCLAADSKHFSRKPNNKYRFLNCLPIIGQISGIAMIHLGSNLIKAKNDEAKKVEGVSATVRGVITFLGLGILCLLLLTIYLKYYRN